VAGSLRLIGKIQEERQEFAAARRAWRETLVIETKLHGDKHWRVADARWALKRLERLERLPAAQRRRHAEVYSLMRKIEALDGQSQFARALPLCRQVVQIHKEVLGEDNPDHADYLYWLGWLSGATGDYAGAEPLMRSALDRRKKSTIRYNAKQASGG
jgi:tetratricopeptide (TPR) repeat protein